MKGTEKNASMGQLVARFLVSAFILSLGIGVFAYLFATRPVPEQVARVDLGELVKVIEVRSSTQPVTVSANGTVTAAQQVSLSAEVNGRVVWLSNELVPGGRLRKGAPLVRLDARDYQLAVEQQNSTVDSARTALQIERNQKQIAEREWALLGGDKPEEGELLALRDPQMRSAQAAFKAAESGLRRAKLNVAKTTVRAPFNAMVQSKSVDTGQVVGPQTPLAALVGTDAFWVQVSVPVERLSWIQIPGIQGTVQGSPVKVVQRLGDAAVIRQGEVIRLLGDLDPQGRMARVLVEIANPLDPTPVLEGAAEDQGQPASGLPLLLGSYVSVEITGKEVDGIIELPRMALRNGDQVFVFTEQNTLAVKKVDILWRKPETVLIAGGIASGEKVVISPLRAPVAGMKLRISDATRRAAKGGEKSTAAERRPGTKKSAQGADRASDSPNDDSSGGPSNGADKVGKGPAYAKPSR